MAWRIAKTIRSGEIDNRIKGRVTGFLELADGSGRVVLDLEGNAHPDLAGSHIRFTNPDPKPGPLENFARHQKGTAGDITASHRVKDLLVPVKEYLEMDKESRAKAYRWANCLYLEWYGERNGRVVMEGVGFAVEWIEGPRWSITEEDLRNQAKRGEQGMAGFIKKLSTDLRVGQALAAEDETEEVSPTEAAMDAEAARMDILTERMGRRLEKEGPENWDRIYREESARLRRERGEPEPPPPTPEEKAEREAWIEEVNAAAQEALEETSAESWKEETSREHPLVAQCHEFAIELREEGLWPEGASDEHPLVEIANGVLFASGKLAGALNSRVEEEAWPPDEWTAPSVLLFLKKARRYLRDAARALDSVDEENLATEHWRTATRTRLNHLMATTQQLIIEARQKLPDNL